MRWPSQLRMHILFWPAGVRHQIAAKYKLDQEALMLCILRSNTPRGQRFLKNPLKPPVMTPAEKEVDEDRKRQLNTLIGLSDQLGPLIREN